LGPDEDSEYNSRLSKMIHELEELWCRIFERGRKIVNSHPRIDFKQSVFSQKHYSRENVLFSDDRKGSSENLRSFSIEEDYLFHSGKTNTPII
jgi:hypothetical protein